MANDLRLPVCVRFFALELCLLALSFVSLFFEFGLMSRKNCIHGNNHKMSKTFLQPKLKDMVIQIFSQAEQLSPAVGPSGYDVSLKNTLYIRIYETIICYFI